MTLTSAELVVLSLVVERPRHGYDLEGTIAARGIRQWTDLAFSSIYYVLAKLESRGFVSSEQGGAAKSRRVYTATDEGCAAATAATELLLANARPSFSPLAVGLGNVDLVDPDRFGDLLRGRVASLTAQVDAVKAARAAQAPLPRAALLVFSYTLAVLVAERDWLVSIESGGLPS